MPLPEGYRPRKGDVVVLHGEVKYDCDLDDRYIFVRMIGTHSEVGIKPSDIVSVKRRSWRNGELVSARPNHRIFGEIVCQSEEVVMVRLALGSIGHKNALNGVRLFHCNELDPRSDEVGEAPESISDALAEKVDATVVEARDAAHARLSGPDGEEITF